MYVRMYVCMYVYLYVYVYVFMHVDVYPYVKVCVDVCCFLTSCVPLDTLVDTSQIPPRLGRRAGQLLLAGGHQRGRVVGLDGPEHSAAATPRQLHHRTAPAVHCTCGNRIPR